jgi:hypothetical protein
MVNRTVVAGLGLGLILLAGCASTSDVAGDPPGTEGPMSNGTLYTSVWDTEAGTRTITGHAIGQDGSVGAAVPLLSGPANDTSFPGVEDGVGAAALTGSFTDFWTTDLQVRSAGEVTAEVAAPRWCGGEGLRYNLCTLLDDTRIARTTDLGRDPETGDGPSEGSILVSSLADGATISELGPFADLSMMLGTGSANHVIIVTTPAQSAEDPSVPSTVLRLDVTDGLTAEIGDSPAGWVPLCPIGSDSVLGFTSEGAPAAVVVGPAEIADVTWDEQDTFVGCSADGRFLYVQRIPQPPTEETEDLEPPNPSTALERISLADGSRSAVLTLPPGEVAGPVTR